MDILYVEMPTDELADVVNHMKSITKLEDMKAKFIKLKTSAEDSRTDIKTKLGRFHLHNIKDAPHSSKEWLKKAWYAYNCFGKEIRTLQDKLGLISARIKVLNRERSESNTYLNMLKNNNIILEDAMNEILIITIDPNIGKLITETLNKLQTI